ncbi:aryl-alcohol dehydrogenase-like predicted oxidoreductase [Geomicrobium halophilum]|uniref:Aryl-alcohol dehydrogenase-like predicted oxidoreductase n=1 Tax=Geomicrobium halophilum TaxID=549000 RepID=A0A841PUN6_9BACL|nr:aldo/keto reductase [Geomicrobium halophilum]MBB6451454.1 aryl-alcohol dehydrogenase-like predicted oxidoreductase [Geomicrobium halophilum]
MEYHRIPKTDIKISILGVGTNGVGGHNLFPNLDENKGAAMVRSALDEGINLVDTADAYGFGRSEEIIGEVIKSRRQDVVLATKGGLEYTNDGTTFNNRPEYLKQAVENSLKRLQTDYIDIYYLHFPDSDVPLSEAIGALSRLKEEGKIRAIGISNVSAEQLSEANRHNDISVLQSWYNMLDRSAEDELLPYCNEQGISFIPFGPLAYGLLSGHYTKDFTPSYDDHRSSHPLFAPGLYEDTIDRVSELKEIADKKGTTVSNLALAWLLAQQNVAAVIPGGKGPDRVQENLRALSVKLSKEEKELIEEVLDN